MATQADLRIAQLVDEYMPKGDFVPKAQAQALVSYLLTNEPDLLRTWLYEHAVSFIQQQMTRRLARRRVTKYPSAYRPVAPVDQNGTPIVSIFDEHYSVGGVRRRLGDLKGADALALANDYEVTGQTSLALATFFRVVAKKVGNRRIQDVYKAETLERIRQSYLKKQGRSLTA